MNNKSNDALIRTLIYGVTIIVFGFILLYKPVLNYMDINKAENCYKSKNYVCAFTAYRKAFANGVNNEKYVSHYFLTLSKIKKITIVQEELNNLLLNYPDNDVSFEITSIFQNMKNQILAKYPDTYIDNVVQGTNVIHWNNRNKQITVFIDKANLNEAPLYYIQEIIKAFDDYAGSLKDVLEFSFTEDKKDANIIVTFVDSLSGGQCEDNSCKNVLGLTENEISGKILRKSTISLRKKDIDNTSFTANQIHNIVKHEIGHALGISGHSYSENDIMYPISNDASWAANAKTLLIQRKQLSLRDIKTIELLYKIIPDITDIPYDTTKIQDMFYPIAVIGTKNEIGEKSLKESLKYANTVDKSFISQVTLAEGYFSNKDYDKAKDAFNQALLYAKTSEEKFNVYNNLAVIAYTQKDYQGAISNAQSALGFSQNPSTNEIMAYSYLELENYKEAQKILEDLVVQKPDDAFYSATLSNVYAKQYKLMDLYKELKRIKKANSNALNEEIYKPYKFFSIFV